MTSKTELASFYADQGWRVFPLKPMDKTPTVKWQNVATTEKNMINGWFEFQPNANIGIATGEKSGITVIDVDADHGGYESLTELIMKYGKLPETPIVKTGGGGEHIFFKYVPGTRNSAGKLGPGLDCRSEGGYVVGGGSTHPNGKLYEWVIRPSQTEVADMPEWLAGLLLAKTVDAVITAPPENGFVSGERNNALTQLAGAMRRKGHDEDGIFAALQIYNRKNCTPSLTDGEVLQIARSVSRYPAKDEIKTLPAIPAVWDVMEKIELEIIERQKNPKDVWGIHYAWPYLSIITGGKQKGELIILAGEPKVGKSWFAHQDAMFTAIGSPSKSISSTPVLIWSGEMSRKQVYRRMFEMLGVPKRHMMTGQMSDIDWQFFNEAKALIVNSPIYVSDTPLDLQNVKQMLEREIGEHGIEQVVFDYDWLIGATGENEIATSQNISREMKLLARELDLSIILISSVNKGGMDTSENVSKSVISGSGKKLHDADVIYVMTKFNANMNKDLSIMPCDYDRISTLHIVAGRELDFHIPNGAVNFMRETPNPKFKELKDLSKPDALPSWLLRKDLV